MNWELWIPVFCLIIAIILNRISINKNAKAIMHLWNRMDEEMEDEE